MALQYRFLPWARRGLARTYTAPSDGALDGRTRIQVGLTLQASADGAALPDVANQIPMRLYGPGDVIGVDPRLIVRTEPKPFVSNFEPNYLAAIEFDPPDFPWLFTPAKADAAKRLRPWLVLVVFDRDGAGVKPPVMRGGPLPRVELSAAQAQSELPPLSESALWAHAQAASDLNDAGPLAAEMRQQPDRNISRLIAPRRLSPATRYIACLVPAFDAGRRIGLGESLGDPNAPLPLGPAWPDDPAQRGATTLPVYFHWEFSTGPLGDFETLARRLKTPKNYPPGTDLNAKLNKLGTAPVLLDADRILTEQGAKKVITYEGALVSLTYQWMQAVVDDVAKRLAEFIGDPEVFNLAQGPATRVPTVGPPIYGGWHAKKHAIPPAELSAKAWLADLNLDPRYRLAAGYAAEVVRQNQEEFMQACWAQVGDVLRAERLLNFGKLAQELARSVFARHLAKLPPERLLCVLGPARGRLLVATAETVLGRIARTSMPDATIDPALRRLTSAQRPMLKAAVRRAGVAQIAVQVRQLFSTLATASQNAAFVDPTQFVPDGILGTNFYDGLQLPDVADALIDLEPLLGVPRTMRAGDIKTIRDSGAQLRQAGGFPRPTPSLQAVRRNGLLTETHRLQLSALQLQSHTPLTQLELGQALSAPNLRVAEGVLLSVPVGQDASALKVTPLSIDGRNGALRVTGTRVRGRALTGALAAVPAKSIKRYGAGTVFATLPVNSLPVAAGAEPVAISAAGAGAFKPTAPGLGVGDAITVTVPTPLRDEVTLTRVSKAFVDYSAGLKDVAAAAGVKVTPTDLPLAATAASALAKVRPEVTIPARMASMLSVDGMQLKADAGGEYASVFVARDVAELADARVRFMIPRTFDRVMAYPHIAAPMYQPLANKLRDAFLPGAEDIPNDFVLLLATNPRFVEAYMVGLNHEMGREMLWRGFPTDQRGTPMQQFWARLDGKTDVEPIHTWNYWTELGAQGAASAEQKSWLVLLIRGELLKRFPNTIIYAQRRSTVDPRKLATLAEYPAGTKMEALIQRPVLVGSLPPDMSFVGFPIVPADRSKWCFVLEEQMTEPRFGFDQAGSTRQRPNPPTNSWKDVFWSDIGAPEVGNGQHFRLADVMRANAKVAAPLRLSASAHSASLAQALLQRPFRGFWVGDDLVPKP